MYLNWFEGRWQHPWNLGYLFLLMNRLWRGLNRECRNRCFGGWLRRSRSSSDGFPRGWCRIGFGLCTLLPHCMSELLGGYCLRGFTHFVQGDSSDCHDCWWVADGWHDLNAYLINKYYLLFELCQAIIQSYLLSLL